jgi:SOS response regulatory protein OraA/RecX
METVSRLKKYALWLLGRRSYSTYEMEKKLKKKQIEWEATEGDVETVITYLITYSFLDDKAYAQSLSRSLQHMGKSTRVTQLKMRQKGIPSEIIDTISFNEDADKEAIQRYIEKHATLEREKLIRRLLYRGFSYSTIQSVMRGV